MDKYTVTINDIEIAKNEDFIKNYREALQYIIISNSLEKRNDFYIEIEKSRLSEELIKTMEKDGSIKVKDGKDLEFIHFEINNRSKPFMSKNVDIVDRIFNTQEFKDKFSR